MKLLKLTHWRQGSALACGAMLAAGLFSVNARADEWTKRTILTVHEPIQVKDTVLQPGTYVLRLILNGTLGVDRHVVQIFNGNETHIINTVVTQVAIRPHATGKTQFTWWETPPGTARALRDWYYPGETTGDEFPYPKQPKMVATVVPAMSTTVASTETTATTTPAEPQPEPAAAPEPAPQNETAEVQPAPAPEPAPAPAVQDNEANREAPPQTLPKTGSPYPLIGLCGMMFAGLGGTLLLKRSA